MKIESRRETTTATVILLAFMTLQCGPHKAITVSQIEGSGHAVDYGGRYKDALARAERGSGADELPKILEKSREIKLSGKSISSLNRLSIGPYQTLLTLDFDRQEADCFDSSGGFIRSVGAKGSGPGSYSWPSGIAQAKAGVISISDFRDHRVNVYSPNGDFLNSFIYGPQVFSAQEILFDDVTRSYYLFGNRWENGPNGKAIGAQLVHRYSETGDFIGSYLPFPDQAKALDLYSSDEPAADTAKGDLFVALPFQYTIYRIRPQGEVSTFITDAPSGFKTPSTRLDTKLGNNLQGYYSIQDWRLSWTPINSLIISGDKLLVQYQTFSPLRYTIDIWSVATKMKTGSIHTNEEMLARDGDGWIYFLKNIESKGQTEYEILRSKLR